jgi:hypothetical protein
MSFFGNSDHTFPYSFGNFCLNPARGRETPIKVLNWVEKLRKTVSYMNLFWIWFLQVKKKKIKKEQNNYWRSVIQERCRVVHVHHSRPQPQQVLCMQCRTRAGLPNNKSIHSTSSQLPPLAAITRELSASGTHACTCGPRRPGPQTIHTIPRRGAGQVASRRETSGASSCPHQSLCVLTPLVS